MEQWFKEKLARLLFLVDALFEAILVIGVVAIVLLSRWVVLWLVSLFQASAESQKFVGWFVLLAEVMLVIACFGVDLAYVVRDIRESWRRAMHHDRNTIVDNRDREKEKVAPASAPQQAAPDGAGAASAPSPASEESKQNDT